jgi:hypothetical protein
MSETRNLGRQRTVKWRGTSRHSERTALFMMLESEKNRKTERSTHSWQCKHTRKYLKIPSGYRFIFIRSEQRARSLFHWSHPSNFTVSEMHRRKTYPSGWGQVILDLKVESGFEAWSTLFAVYLTTLSVAQNGAIRGESIGRKLSWANLRYPAWKNWRKPRNPSVRRASIRAKTRAAVLPYITCTAVHSTKMFSESHSVYGYTGSTFCYVGICRQMMGNLATHPIQGVIMKTFN